MAPPRDPETGKRVIDSVKDIFSGTPLADSDGINQSTYESKKAMIEL